MASSSIFVIIVTAVRTDLRIQWTMSAFYEHKNKPSGFVKTGNLLAI